MVLGPSVELTCVLCLWHKLAQVDKFEGGPSVAATSDLLHGRAASPPKEHQIIPKYLLFSVLFEFRSLRLSDFEMMSMPMPVQVGEEARLMPLYQ